MKSATPVFEAHRERLVRCFAHDVVELGARTLLDVGCGRGLLLASLGETEVAARGIDTSVQRLAAARESGLTVWAADACALPFTDRSFDWVVIRHVLHHLDDPGAVVREACRVARIGLILAEPMSELSIPSQAAMARFDAFTTELMAQADHIHHPYLAAGELIDLLPAEPERIETRSYGELTMVPESEVIALVRKAARGRDLDANAIEQMGDYARAAADHALTYNGSLAVFVHGVRT